MRQIKLEQAMKTLLTAQSLTLDIQANILLKDTSFTLRKGNRIGLIGYNGSGKSTLLKVLDSTLTPTAGEVHGASRCVITRVEQHLPDYLYPLTALEALISLWSKDEQASLIWKAEALLSTLGFHEDEKSHLCKNLSGGQYNRLLLARALLCEPDLLLMDEPSNHLDMASMCWLEQFLSTWKGSFVLVSHDIALLDSVTDSTWILRDKKLHTFDLPCTEARQALAEQDAADALRYAAERKEIDRIESSAKRLADWGKTFDNEDLSRKAKTMEKRAERLTESMTTLTQGSQWFFSLKGERIVADRLMSLDNVNIRPFREGPLLFHIASQRIKSGECIALTGHNGCGKSTFTKTIWEHYQETLESSHIRFNPRTTIGYYDQSLHQLNDDASLMEALVPFEHDPQQRKHALIHSGFGWNRHHQKVRELSGGERARLLFLGLSLARYSLLILDEPTNHLDMEGKEALAESLCKFEGAIILVTHDRWLITECCHRIWHIDDGELHEHGSLEMRVAGKEHAQANTIKTNIINTSGSTEDSHFYSSETMSENELLERVVELESRLEADLARKQKHQKPALQRQWREEIAQLYRML